MICLRCGACCRTLNPPVALYGGRPCGALCLVDGVALCTVGSVPQHCGQTTDIAPVCPVGLRELCLHAEDRIAIAARILHVIEVNDLYHFYGPAHVAFLVEQFATLAPADR